MVSLVVATYIPSFNSSVVKTQLVLVFAFFVVHILIEIKYLRLEYLRLEYLRLEYLRLEYLRLEYLRLEYLRLEYLRLEYLSGRTGWKCAAAIAQLGVSSTIRHLFRVEPVYYQHC
jgi:hypothetical protein